MFKVATIIILEYACRFRASSPGSTRAKALDNAFSQYKQSGTHTLVKMQFPGPAWEYFSWPGPGFGYPRRYYIPSPQFAEFILQHRL